MNELVPPTSVEDPRESGELRGGKSATAGEASLKAEAIAFVGRAIMRSFGSGNRLGFEDPIDKIVGRSSS